MEDRSSRRVRTLVTRKARGGLSANEIACALISMMARSTCSNQRPDTLMQDRICQVDETSCNARPDHTIRVIRVDIDMSALSSAIHNTVVCTENLNPTIMVMKSAKDGA
jgi:hypothetical protein